MATFAILTAWSCQQSAYEDCINPEYNSSTRRPIIFGGKVATRMVNNTFEENDKIGVFMIKTGTNLSSENIIGNATNRKYTYQTNQFVPNSKNDTLYYPNEAVDFIAYYPYKAVNDFKTTIDISNQSNPSAIDFLYSNSAKNITGSSNNPELEFKHILSKLEFNIKAGTGYSFNDLKNLKLSIKDVWSKATLDFNGSNIDAVDSSTKEITAIISEKSNTEQKNNYILAEIIVIPQECKDLEVKVTLSSRRSFTFKIATDNWAKSTKYIYNLTLDKDDYSVPGINATITDWSDGGAASLDQEGSSTIDASIWNGSSYNTDWYNSQDNTFDIVSAEELAGFAHLVNQGTTFENCTINLLANIDLNNHSWTPIGNTAEKTFKGTLEGGNRTISGLNTTLLEGSTVSGLFGINDGTIKNVNVNGTINCTGTVTGTQIGGIAAVNNKAIEGCCNYASITGTLATIASGDAHIHIGGITGYNNGSISNCQNQGTVDGSNPNSSSNNNTSEVHIGGIVGYSLTNVTSCENNQNISATGNKIYAGGIVGAINKKDGVTETITVTSCQNYGNVTTSESGNDSNVAGIVGYIHTSGITIASSHNYAEISASCKNGNRNAFAGGIVASNQGGIIQNCSNSSSVTANNTNQYTNDNGTISYYGSIAGGIIGYNKNGGSVHNCKNESAAIVTAQRYIGGIAGLNKMDGTSAENGTIYSCNTNNGMPSKWIGNAAGSNVKSDVTTCTETHE